MNAKVVKLKGGLYPANEQIRDARITQLGASPAARLKLYSAMQRRRPTGKTNDKGDPEFESYGPVMFEEYDSLSEATITEKGDKLVITGRSGLAQENFPGEDAALAATWEVTVAPCSDCGS